MAFRPRIDAIKLTDKENVLHAKATCTSRIPKRLALRDLASNTVGTTKLREPAKKTVSQNQSIVNPQPAKAKGLLAKKEAEISKNKELAKYRNPLANLRPSVPRKPPQLNTEKSKPVKVFSPVVIPDNIINVDKNCKGDIFSVSEYVNDIYKYLRYLELQFPIQENYLLSQIATPKMRAVLVDWLVGVQQEYRLSAETLHLSIAIVDLFLQKFRVVKDKIQLVGVTAMFIASKYEETYHPDIYDVPDISHFVFITDETYTKEQILSMERIILRKLDFSLGRPSSIHFLRRYAKAAETTTMHHTFGKYFIDLALLEYNLVHVRPSLVAAVAFFIAHSIYKCDKEPSPDFWNETMVFYSSYKFSDLKPYIPVLASAIVKASTSKHKAIPEKFSSEDLFYASRRIELTSKELLKLAKGSYSFL